MAALLDRRLLVVTGKGGVGKTTIAAALGLMAAEQGRRALVVELGHQSRLPEIFGLEAGEQGTPTRLLAGLSSLTVDPDRALLEWLQALGGRVSGRILASSGTFQYFAAAAPGARELVAMIKVWRLTQGKGAKADLVILDAPATGHALGLLRSPHTFGAIARVGPVARHAEQVGQLLGDPARSAYLGVALPTEMAVTEALELQDGLQAALGRDLEDVVVNGLLPRRFQAAELDRAELALQDELAPSHPAGARPRGARTRDPDEAALLRAALDAAREAHDRGAFQHNQVARLRRRGFQTIGTPFLWHGATDAEAVRTIAGRLAQGLAR